MTVLASNPNPQPVKFAAYETPTFYVTYYPPQTIAGQTFQLNVRQSPSPQSPVLLTVSTFAVVDSGNGSFTLTPTSLQTGSVLGPGDYYYDIWRTNAGFEKRLCYGPLTVTSEQWR